MTVQNPNPRADYTGNGTAKDFPVPFYFIESSHLEVIDTVGGASTTLVENSDYSVAGAGNPAGGIVTTLATAAYDSTHTLAILLNVPYTQLIHYVENDPFPAASHEKGLDLAAMRDLQLKEQMDRSITLIDQPADGYVLGWVSGRLRNLSAATAQLAADLLSAVAGKGAQLITYLAPFTNSVARLLHLKLAEVPSPLDFGGVGDGTADDTQALVDLFAASKQVSLVGPEYVWKVIGTITPQTGTTVNGEGATITQATAQTPILDIRSLTDVTIRGTKFVGIRDETYVDSSQSLALAIRGGSSVNTTIEGCSFKYFGYSPFYGESLVNFKFIHNTVIGPGLIAAGGILNPTATPTITRNNTGVTCGGAGILIAGNEISETGQGLIVAQGSTKIRVHSNNIFDIRVEHGMYCDTGMVGLAINGNTLKNCYQNGIKVQHYDAFDVVPTSINISGNTIDTTVTGDGIIINNSNPAVAWLTSTGYTAGVSAVTNGGSAYKCLVTHTSGTFATDLAAVKWALMTNTSPIHALDVSIGPNTIRNIGQDGLSIRYTKGGIVSSNLMHTLGRKAFYLDNNIDLALKTNFAKDSQENSVFDVGTNVNVSLLGNDLLTGGLSGNNTNGVSSAIFIQGGTGWVFKNNTVKGDNTKTQYALYMAGGTQSTMIIRDNEFLGAKDYGIRVQAALFQVWSGNLLDGLLGQIHSGIPTTNQLGDLAHLTFYGSAMPASGTWTAGAIVWNTGVTNAAGQPIGWVRVTTGSNNVLNTDWRVFGVTT